MPSNDFNWSNTISEILAGVTSLVTVVLAYKLQVFRVKQSRDDGEPDDE